MTNVYVRSDFIPAPGFSQMQVCKNEFAVLQTQIQFAALQTVCKEGLPRHDGGGPLGLRALLRRGLRSERVQAELHVGALRCDLPQKCGIDLESAAEGKSSRLPTEKEPRQ